MYGEFASWYDTMMREADYGAWAGYVSSLLREHGASTVLECACGTGNLSVRLAKEGFKLTATDLSDDMLMVHREKMRKAGLMYPVVREDMNDIRVHRPVDAVVAACDGVNYLLDGPEAFFESAFQALKPGGVLLFDISSAHKLKALEGTSFSDSDEDWAYICDCMSEGAGLLKLELTAFVREGKLFRRFRESHVQRAYTAEEIQSALLKSTFSDVKYYDCFTCHAAAESSERLQFVAVKPKE